MSSKEWEECGFVEGLVDRSSTMDESQLMLLMAAIIAAGDLAGRKSPIDGESVVVNALWCARELRDRARAMEKNGGEK